MEIYFVLLYFLLLLLCYRFEMIPSEIFKNGSHTDLIFRRQNEGIIEKKKLDIESIGKRNQLNWKEVRLQTLMR